jgi:hypothetical protein
MSRDITLDQFVANGLAALPRQLTRVQLAGHVSKTLFQVAPSTTRRWPLKWLHVNGRAVCHAREGLTVAWHIANADRNTRRLPPHDKSESALESAS